MAHCITSFRPHVLGELRFVENEVSDRKVECFADVRNQGIDVPHLEWRGIGWGHDVVEPRSAFRRK